MSPIASCSCTAFLALFLGGCQSVAGLDALTFVQEPEQEAGTDVWLYEASNDAIQILVDGSGADSNGPCTSSGTELCDGVDNDCNGQIDDGFNFSTDPLNCGVCPSFDLRADCTLAVQNAEHAKCTAVPGTLGQCDYDQCIPDYHDIDVDRSNGCEYYCVKRSDADLTCNGADDDCDGHIDEDVDLCHDTDNCGACGRQCSKLSHGSGVCEPLGSPAVCGITNTVCVVTSCDTDFFDVDGVSANGCEYYCVRSGRIDPADPNSIVACSAPEPPAGCGTIDYSDGTDNDCDGVIDEDPAAGPPATTCPVAYDSAQFPGDRTKGLCRPGHLDGASCVGGIGPAPESCDGLDNDCDGPADEEGPGGLTDPLLGKPCGTDVGECTAAVWVCAGGQMLCLGSTAPRPETCDCQDNDCDGETDEDPGPGSGEAALCSEGKSCVRYEGFCQCAAPCSSGEFPCPTGGYSCQEVSRSSNPTDTDNRCVSSKCAGGCENYRVENVKVECAPEGTLVDGVAPPICQCKGEAGCQRPCFKVSCTDGLRCTEYGPRAGECVADNCYYFPCEGEKACNAGNCVDSPCTPDSCPGTDGCRPSDDFTKAVCFPSCANVACGATERCVDGVCQPTGCDQQCPAGQVCSGGSCTKSKCDPNPCTDGSWCDPVTGWCGNEPCAGVVCSGVQECVDGQCVGLSFEQDGGSDGSTQADSAVVPQDATPEADAEPAVIPDPPQELKVGCSCQLQSNRATAVWPLLLLAAAVLRRRSTV